MSYNETDFLDMMEYNYHQYTSISLLTCGVFILTSITNICMISSINKKINELSNKINYFIIPPEYKINI